jgi:hypothetical protein
MHKDFVSPGLLVWFDWIIITFHSTK